MAGARGRPTQPPDPRWLREQRAAQSDAGATSPVNWELIGQVLGVIAGLGAWIGVVGGARLWARLESVGLPALATMTEVDRGAFLVEGLQTLVGPVVLGGLVALLVYFSRLEDAPPGRSPVDETVGRRRLLPVAHIARLRGSRGPYAVLVGFSVAVLVWLVTMVIADARWDVLLAGCALGGVAIVGAIRYGMRGLLLLGILLIVAGSLGSLVFSVRVTQLVIMFVATLVAVWVTLGALHSTQVGRAALVLFVALVAWSGALSYAQERGDRTPDLVPATVQRTSGLPLSGYYLGRSPTHLLLAQGIEADTVPYVVSLPFTEISSYAFGKEAEVPEPLKTEAAGQDKGVQKPPPTPPTPPTPSPVDPTRAPPSPEPTRRPPVDGDGTPPPTPAPPDDVAAITSKDATIGTQPAQLQVLSLERQPNGYLALEVRLWNFSDDWLRIGSTFGLSAGDASFAGVEIFDPVNDQTYGVIHTDDGCVCEKGLYRVAVAPGGWRHLTAAFEATEPVGPTVDIRVPAFGWIRGVTVS